MKKIDIENIINKIYDFTIKYIESNGFPPSIREICSKFSIKSTATAYSYIEKLKNRGLLEKTPLKKRAISINKKQKTNFKSIPLIGTITAGNPIFAVENLDGYYPLPPDFIDEEDIFALKVKGESMIKCGIYDKDIIIVKKTNYAINGQIIVALVDDSATVKRFFRSKDKIILHPENDSMEDMYYDNITILGIVKGLYRKF